VTLASDLELNLVGLLVLLYARRYIITTISLHSAIHCPKSSSSFLEVERGGRNVHKASLRRHISMNCLISETSAGMIAVLWVVTIDETSSDLEFAAGEIEVWERLDCELGRMRNGVVA
jgi:hypothetical protein